MTGESKPQNDDFFVYADSYRTKDLIWDAYIGFVQNYGVYSMYRRDFNRNNKIARSGAIRYANEFYHEVNSFLDSFKTNLGEDNIKKLRSLFTGFTVKLTDEDLYFLRTFYDVFMVKAGFKSIVMIKDNRDAATRFMNERYSDIEWKGVPDDKKE